MTSLDLKDLMNTTELNITDLELGIMWELVTTNNQNYAHVYRPFEASNLREEWRYFAAKLIGMTELMDTQIDEQGTCAALESLGG